MHAHTMVFEQSVEVNVRGSIQVSMHKMLRREKKGPYDNEVFV